MGHIRPPKTTSIITIPRIESVIEGGNNAPLRNAGRCNIPDRHTDLTGDIASPFLFTTRILAIRLPMV